MLTYIAVILTIHVIISTMSVIVTLINQRKHFKMVQAEIDERNRFFTEIERWLKESEVEEE